MLYFIIVFSLNAFSQIEIVNTYFESGALKSKVARKDSLNFGIFIEYYESGTINIECVFDNGKLNGPFKLYYNSGQLQRDGYFYNDLPVGEHRFYEMDGTITKKGNYNEQGEHDGIWELYYDGKLDKKILYKNDKIVKIILDNFLTAPIPQVED